MVAPDAAPVAVVPTLGGKRLRVCVDAGHGGQDPGAVGPTGKREADTTLAVALLVAEELSRAGAEAVLTRAADQTTELLARTKTAKDEDTHCLVSIHCNAVSKSTVTGCETIHDATSADGKALANTVHQSYMKFASGHKDRGLLASPSPLYPRRLHVLASAGRAACLVELEFISNPAMEQWLLTEAARSGAAFAISRGVLQWAKSRPDYAEAPASASA